MSNINRTNQFLKKESVQSWNHLKAILGIFYLWLGILLCHLSKQMKWKFTFILGTHNEKLRSIFDDEPSLQETLKESKSNYRSKNNSFATAYKEYHLEDLADLKNVIEKDHPEHTFLVDKFDGYFESQKQI